jgi:NDP-sugar pyrophosphorylase family protein
MTLPTVVLAGGVGSRLASVTGGLFPKVLVDVAGRPFLDRKLDELASQGVEEVFLLIGHQADQVRSYLSERPRRDPSVTCIDDGPVALGTGGAIVAACGLLPGTFFVTYGDTLLDQSMAAVEEAFHRSGRPALMTVVRNEDRKQASNVSIAGDLVVAYSKTDPLGTHSYLDYGLLVFRREVLAVPRGEPYDLAFVVSALVKDGLVSALVVDAEFHDVGTSDALLDTASCYLVDRPSDSRS